MKEIGGFIIIQNPSRGSPIGDKNVLKNNNRRQFGRRLLAMGTAINHQTNQ